MNRSTRISALTSNSTSASTNRKRKAEEEQVIVPIKQLYFHGPYIRQNWPFRDSLINYITKNPKTSKVWQKLIQSCKYFFAKNQILVIENLWWDEEDWCASLNNDAGPVDFTKISLKLWITNKFNATYVPPENEISSIIPKIYKCDVKYLCLTKDVISYEDFSFLSSNVEDTENIVKKFRCYDKNDSSCITKNTVKELFKIPHFSKINKLYFFLIPETFDIETFFTYLKKNKHTKFSITFGNSISETYKNRLEEIVDEIIESEKHDYTVPNIMFNGIDGEKLTKLCSLSYP